MVPVHLLPHQQIVQGLTKGEIASTEQLLVCSNSDIWWAILRSWKQISMPSGSALWASGPESSFLYSQKVGYVSTQIVPSVLTAHLWGTAPYLLYFLHTFWSKCFCWRAWGKGTQQISAGVVIKLEHL
jgi:hypothetical protein